MSTGVDVVEVLPGATSGCFCTTPPCTWWMGVVAYSAYGANFTIMVQSGTSPVNLNDGVAQGGGVGQGFSVYYRFIMHPGDTCVAVCVLLLRWFVLQHVCGRGASSRRHHRMVADTRRYR